MIASRSTSSTRAFFETGSIFEKLGAIAESLTSLFQWVTGVCPHATTIKNTKCTTESICTPAIDYLASDNRLHYIPAHLLGVEASREKHVYRGGIRIPFSGRLPVGADG